MKIWIKEQVDWIKSFFCEKRTVNGKMMGSIKRLISFMVAFTFLNSYGYIVKRQLDNIKDISQITFPDIPPMWATLLGGIIGLHILSNYIDKKK